MNLATAPVRPELLPLLVDRIPEVLREIAAWIGWRLVWKPPTKKKPKGYWSKVPVDIKTGKAAKTNDPTTWTDYPTAVRDYKSRGCDGIGLCRLDGYVFIDLDGGFDMDGTPRYQWAEQIMSTIKGCVYLEKSITANGGGVHAIGKGQLPPGRCQWDHPDKEHVGYALYSDSRYFTISGHVLATSANPDFIPGLADLRRELFPDADSQNGNGNGTAPREKSNKPRHAPQVRVVPEDEPWFATAMKENGGRFAKLWNGDITGYRSQSEADLALCSKLAFYTGRDAVKMDVLFRESKLMRSKWDERNGYYGDRTIAFAIGKTGDVWIPPKKKVATDADERDAYVQPVKAEIVAEKEQVAAEESAGPPQYPAEPEQLPRVKCSGRQLPEVSDDALKHLQAANRRYEVLYARSGEMVAIVRDEEGRQVISAVDIDDLRGRLARVAHYYRLKEKNGVTYESDCDPPPNAVKDIAALAPSKWGFRPVTAITEIPILRPDGTILERSGYDPVTRLYYSPDPGLRIPRILGYPSAEDIAVALEKVREPLADFPFVDDASKANMLAALLSPVIKPAIDDCVPMALFDAPQAGTGKSLLAEILAIIATGRNARMIAAPKRDEDEWRKRLTMALNSGISVIIFDNIMGPLDSGDLCAVLTADTWTDRRMATHDDISLPVKAVFVATGNNIRLGGDMPRRCFKVRLDAECAQPFMRTGPKPDQAFAIEKLKAWTKKHRGELLAALLTLARAWYTAGKPKPKVKELGSFEEWTKTAGGILEFAGVEGFLDNLQTMYAETDDEAIEWEGFLEALKVAMYDQEFVISEVEDVLNGKTLGSDGKTSEPTERAKTLKASLPGKLAEALARPGTFAIRAGMAFRAKADRRFGSSGTYLKLASTAGHMAHWRVC